VLRALHRQRRHRLTERDRRRLHNAAARLARADRAARLELALEFRQFDAQRAAEAARVSRITVQLDDFVLRHARGLVQVVDVLRDDGARFPGSNQLRDRVMAAVRLRADPAVAIVEAPSPRLAPLLFRREELLEVNWLHPRPDAAGTAKVGNAGLGADARAGEEEGALATVEQRAQRCYFGRHT